MKLVLASRSPRRQLLLREAGYEPCVTPSPIDEQLLVQGRVGPEAWVLSLAYIKAWSTIGQMTKQKDIVVLGADTLCVLNGKCIGQPKDRAEAYGMINHLQGNVHQTVTGVCLLSHNHFSRQFFFDSSRVNIGPISQEVIEHYVQTDAWQGKAGAYNLSERQAAGWPIDVDGDPTTVMGLPMERLAPWLDRIGVNS